MHFTNIAIPGSFLEKYRNLLCEKLNLRNSIRELEAIIREANTLAKNDKCSSFEKREKQNAAIKVEMEIVSIQKRIEEIDIKLKEISPNLIQENKTKVNTL